MIRGKTEDLTEAEKCNIVKEITKGISPKVVATSIGRHVDTGKRYLVNPSPRMTQSDAGVTDRELRNVKR